MPATVSRFAVERDVAERRETLEAGYVLEDQGLLITRDLTEAEWVDLGRVIARRANASTWQLGDWLVYGARGDKGNRWVGAQAYKEAAEITGLSENYLGRLFAIARDFPRGRRVLGVSFTAHLHVERHVERPAAQDRWLKQAGENRWTFDELASRIEASGEAPPIPRVGRRRSGGSVVLCPQCKHRFPVRGNKAPKEKR